MKCHMLRNIICYEMSYVMKCHMLYFKIQSVNKSNQNQCFNLFGINPLLHIMPSQTHNSFGMHICICFRIILITNSHYR